MAATVIKQIDVSGIDNQPFGLAHDGKYLWYSGNQNNKLYQLDLDGNLIRTLDTLAIDNLPQGLARFGKYLIFVGLQNGDYNVIDLNGNLVFINDGVLEPRSITSDGKYVWVINDYDDKIYMMTFTKGLHRWVQIFSVKGNDSAPQAVAFDGKNLWVVTSTNQYLHLFDRTGNVIQEISISGIDITPRDITWDGKSLWMVGWTNQKIYQLRI